MKIEAHAAWLAARDPRCPWPARLVGLLVTAYALSPIDLVPDFIPVLGLLDDAVLIPAGLWLFRRLLPVGLMEEKRAIAAAAAERPRSAWGVVLVLLVWAAAGLIVLHMLGFRWA